MKLGYYFILTEFQITVLKTYQVLPTTILDGVWQLLLRYTKFRIIQYHINAVLLYCENFMHGAEEYVKLHDVFVCWCTDMVSGVHIQLLFSES